MTTSVHSYSAAGPSWFVENLCHIGPASLRKTWLLVVSFLAGAVFDEQFARVIGTARFRSAARGGPMTDSPRSWN
jgi:hypothetical protein